MNYANMDRLIAFFDEGAPHTTFTMNKGLAWDITTGDDDPLPKSMCGTAGCIAGLAAQLSLADLSEARREEWVYNYTCGSAGNPGDNFVEGDWDMCLYAAIKWMGMEDLPPEAGVRPHFKHSI